ncbi:MAG: M23 family metallopeptidase [Pseudomonadota bacterium]
MTILARSATAILAALLACAAAPTATSQTPAPPQLSLPLACEPGRTCELQHNVDRDPGPGARDYRCQSKTYDTHTGVDIRVPDMAAQRRGVAVLAAAPGKVLRVRSDQPDRVVGQGGLNPHDPVGLGNVVVLDHGGGWITAYGHMAAGSVTLKPGDVVRRGQPLGKVGMSGLTEFPHVHMEVRQGGKVVDPFAPDMSNPAACAAQAGLWDAATAQKLAYKPGAILNAGFTSAQPSMVDVENAAIQSFNAASPSLIVYVRAIALLPGDEREIVLRGPDGAILAEGRQPALARWRAQDLHVVGRRRPAAGWARGTYVAEYRVLRAGKVALSRRLETRL